MLAPTTTACSPIFPISHLLVAMRVLAEFYAARQGHARRHRQRTARVVPGMSWWASHNGAARAEPARGGALIPSAEVTGLRIRRRQAFGTHTAVR